MRNIILKSLNAQQKEAVTHGTGPLLIIAGAGTGKTRVITRRIAHIIAKKWAKPEEILALTFTDKAAAEMEERADVLVPYGYTDIWISTFHAFGDRILRENALELGLDPNFKVLTRPEQIIFFREHLFEFPLHYYRPLSKPTCYIEAMTTLFSRAKDEDIGPEEYLEYVQRLKEKAKNDSGTLKNTRVSKNKTISKNVSAFKARSALKDTGALKYTGDELAEQILREEETGLTYSKYQELLAKFGKVDFGNQGYLALQLFRTHPLILRRYQEQFRYILVDEFQDTNFAQFQLIKLLSLRNQNITVVCDDDQSIYKFRGAAVSNILNFIDTYPRLKQIVLTKNYRSTQIILDNAYHLIKHNNPDRLEVKNQVNKHLEGLKKRGKQIQYLHYDTVSGEADAISKIIEEGVTKGQYAYQDFAILVRSNNNAESFLRALNMRGIPWRFSGNQGLYSCREIRLIVAFLRTIANLYDSASLYALVSSSEIYCLDMLALTECMNYATRKNASLFNTLKQSPQISQFKNFSLKIKAKIEKIVKDIENYIELSREHTTGQVLYKFLNESGYIARLVKEETVSNDNRLSNIANFFNIVRSFETLVNEDRVAHFINHLDMLIDAGDDPAVVEADLDTPAVNVLTVHKAKGLEFTVVFLVGLVMGRFPWPRRSESIKLPDELIKDILPPGDFHIQEERRLFYVGMTRAKKELYLTCARDYGGTRSRKVSQFILEALDLPKTEVKITKSAPLEAIKRHGPKAEHNLKEKDKIPKNELITLSYFQIDDYLTCPLKYKYVHILRIPILRHHAVVYGKAIHDAIQHYHQCKVSGKGVSDDDLIGAFRSSWISEGFLSWEHEEQRLKAGEVALRRFFHAQEKEGVIPTYVEKRFSFTLGHDRIVGRWDRIDTKNGKAAIIDFKSSEVFRQKEADKRVKKSLQLSIYALAYKKVFGSIPDRVQLHFLESGLLGVDQRSEEDLENVIKKIKEASRGIRQRNFKAKPQYLACRYCAYRDICPHLSRT